MLRGSAAHCEMLLMGYFFKSVMMLITRMQAMSGASQLAISTMSGIWEMIMKKNYVLEVLG